MAGGQSFAAAAGSLGRAVTLALVGAAITAAAGVATPNTDGSVPLTGQSAAISQGAAAPGTSKAASGSESTSAAGSAGVASTQSALTSPTITVSAGSVSPQGDGVTVNISGVEAQFYAGTVDGGSTPVTTLVATAAQTAPTINVEKALSGLEASSALGSVAPAQEADDTLITSSSGSAVAALSVGLSGASSTLESGTVEVTGDSFAALTGEAVTTEAGSVEPGESFPISGVEIVSASQTMGAPGGAALSGSELTAEAGDVFTTNDRTASLVGISVSVDTGLTFASPLAFAIGEESIVIAQEIGPRELALIGQEAAAEIGSVDILAPEVGSGPFYKRFKRKYAVWIGGVRYLGTQEDFEKLVEEHITDGDMLAPVISVEANRKFQDEARELERQLNELAKQVKRRYKLTDKEILDFL